MDGSGRNKIIRAVLFCVLTRSTTVLCQAQPVREPLQIGLLPPLHLSMAQTVVSPYHFNADSSFARSWHIVYERLVDALREEHLTLTSQEALAAVLHASPDFNPFVPDSVQRLCRSLRLHKLLLPTFAPSETDTSGTRRWRLHIGWLDAASGETTKFQTAEFESDSLVPSFDAKTFVRALLDAPEFIITQEQSLSLLPVLKDLPSPVVAQSASPRWRWYVSAAVLLGGGSAYWLLKEKGKPLPKRLLPEPPAPPPR